MTDTPTTAIGTESKTAETRVTDLVVRLAFLGLFAYWSLTLVAPFLPVVIWSVILAVALYPVYAWLNARLGGRARIAAFLVGLLAFATVVGPIAMLAASLAESLALLAQGVVDGTLRIPPPDEAVADLPIIGQTVQRAWSLASSNLDAAIQQYGPSLMSAGGMVLGKLASIGADLLVFLVSVVIAGFLLVPGPRLAAGARAFASRIIEPRGGHFVDLAGATIRNVSRGVVGVAFIQALLAGIVLEVAGIWGAGLFAFAILLLGIMQVGAAPVLLPIIIWAWMSIPTGQATLLTLVLAPVMLVDNVLKPILMARGLTTPMLVILTGVIGGTISYGLIGLFLGPIVLAVFYELVVAWVQLEDGGDGTPAGSNMG